MRLKIYKVKGPSIEKTWNRRATAHAADPSVCTKETCIEKGPQRSVPCPLEALVVEKCNRCCFHMTGQRFDPFRCLFAVHIYIYTVHIQYIYMYIYITAEQQQDSCPNHAKQRPRTMPKCCLRNALGAEWASKTFGGRLWSVKYQKLASQAFGGPLPKQPNSSRIRVQTMRNSDHAQCRNVAYETH